MRIIQDAVRYESEVKQTLAHVHYKENTCLTWGINYNDYNSLTVKHRHLDGKVYKKKYRDQIKYLDLSIVCRYILWYAWI